MLLTIIFLIVYFLDILFLFLYGMHTYFMIYFYKKHYSQCSLKKYSFKKYPNVTIQLPVFNEKYVLQRLVKKVIEMDYPKTKKEIQILDDSTDETLELSKKLVKKYKKLGYDIKLLHRIKRTGHKGGALREGLVKAKGEFLAIFDADFLPAKNFLKATVPYFLEDSKIGMVQTRWGHVNAEYSLLTRAQAIGVDGHFIIDQVARSGSNFFMNFNGTAGIWRKECIIDAGNWQDDTLTEDFDLSYRAELKGWKFKYIKDVVNPAELPVQVSAYKSQQFRWAKGSIQTGVKLMGKILKSKQPFLVKLEALVHLTYYSIHPLMVLNVLLSVLTIHMNFLFNHYVWLFVFATFFGIALFGPIIFYGFSQYVLYDDWKKKIKWVPLMTLVGTGIAINNTHAFLEAIIGKKSEFIRTPKLGIKSKKQSWKNSNYKISISFISFLELFLGLYALYGVYAGFVFHRLLAVPFLLIYATSFLYIFILTLVQEGVFSKKIKISQTS